MAKIELINISKKFEPQLNLIPILFKESQNKETVNPIKNLSLTIPDAKVMVVLGPTGCGKTTLLRIIAGLIQQDSGEVKFNGINMIDISTKERKIGMVFQNYALYPHLKSKTNVLSYFLFKKKTPELKEIAEDKYIKTSKLLGVDINYLMNRKPGNLSGGEKQRVAIGRCITREPELFLLDEPFSNLDQRLREKYRLSLKILLKNFNITTIYVTHDQREAHILADIIAIMNNGRIEQVDTFDDIYNNPNNIFIAEFLNLDQETPAINLIDGGVISDDLQNIIFGVRPENIEIKSKKGKNYVKGKIIDIRNIVLKNNIIVTIDINGNVVNAQIPLIENLSLENSVYLKFKKHLYFDKKSGQTIKNF